MTERPDPVFEAPWHAHVFALTVHLNEAGHFAWADWAERFGATLARHGVARALNGGEDYELLFTVDEKDLEKIRLMPSVYIIGEITNKTDGIKLHTTGGNIHPLKAQGWNHFEEGESNN